MYLHPAEMGVAPALLPREPSSGEAMNTLFQAEDASIAVRKRIAIGAVALALFGLALWAGIAMASHLMSGR